jgi:hypothetical protein
VSNLHPKYDPDNPDHESQRYKNRNEKAQFQGPPAEDHPRRCIGKCRHKKGKRCSNWGMVGTDPPRCRRHWGRLNKNARKGARSVQRVPYVYKKFLGPKLTEAVKEATGVDPDEQTAIFTELALIREYAGNFVKLYSAVIELPEDNTKKAELILATGAQMQAALEAVSEVASKAAKIQDKQKGRFSIHDLKYVIDKIMLLHHQVCGKEYRHLAIKFAEAIDKELRLPGTGDQPSSLHPDETARAYDATVPFVPEHISRNTSEDEDEDDDDGATQ